MSRISRMRSEKDNDITISNNILGNGMRRMRRTMILL